MDCLFCQVAHGTHKVHTVYEDDFTVAFLDIHPIREGHVLVIPKKHEPDFYKLDGETYRHLMATVKNMSSLLEATLDPHKVGVIIAGWDVPHAHVHIVPMQDYHDITSKPLLEGRRANPTNEELAKVAQQLRSALP